MLPVVILLLTSGKKLGFVQVILIWKLHLNPGFVKEVIKEDDNTNHLLQMSLFWILLYTQGFLPYLNLNFIVH